MSRLIDESDTTLEEQIHDTGHFTVFYDVRLNGEWVPRRYFTGDYTRTAESEEFEEGQFGAWFRVEYGLEPTLEHLRLVAVVAGDRADEQFSQEKSRTGTWTVFFAFCENGVDTLGHENPHRWRHVVQESDVVHTGRQARDYVLELTDGTAFIAAVCSGKHPNADFGKSKDGDVIWCTIEGGAPQPPAAEEHRHHRPFGGTHYHG